jgi:hypothetical protein
MYQDGFAISKFTQCRSSLGDPPWVVPFLGDLLGCLWGDPPGGSRGRSLGGSPSDFLRYPGGTEADSMCNIHRNQQRSAPRKQFQPILPASNYALRPHLSQTFLRRNNIFLMISLPLDCYKAGSLSSVRLIRRQSLRPCALPYRAVPQLREEQT